MTSGHRPRPAGAPAGWQDRQPAGAPTAEDEAAKEARSGTDGALFPDTGKKAPNETENDTAEAVEGDFAALLDEAKRERDEYLELAQRAKADFENYRKRAAQQATDAERRAKASLATSILPALDNLERALQAASADDPLADGVRLVLDDLNGALTRAGVESFDPTGEKFDPTTSEALGTQPSDGAKPGTVVEVTGRGYRLGDHVIRPARVVVAE